MGNFIQKSSLVLNKIILVVCLMIFYSCGSSSQTESSDEVNGGCGSINANRGNMSIFSEIDSTQYILTILTKELTTVKDGTFSLESKNTQLEERLSNRVFLLDFNTKEKKYDKMAKGMEGYIFPCSDILSNSHVPDSLRLIKGEIKISVSEKQNKGERIYILEISDAEFSNGDKTKVIKNYKSKKLLFTEGNPG